MNRFTIFVPELGYFKAGKSKSLYWKETDFVEKCEDAYWYKTRDAAMKKACILALCSGGNDVPTFEDVEVEAITVTICTSVRADSAKSFMQAEYDEQMKSFVDVDALTYKQIEELPEKVWYAHLKAKNFKMAFEGRFGG